jgi:ABC-2 type transport system permease protein
MSGLEATRPASTAGLAPPEWGGFDPARTRGAGGEALRSFRTSTRLGWQMEANWTDPLLFFIYSVAKPVSSALILVFMLEVIGGGGKPEYRAFVVIGSALWAFVLSGISGLAWSVLDDRERYRMLKYVYVSPSDFLIVLLGRGVARVAVGAMGALITLGVGVVALGVPFNIALVNWPLLVVVMAFGLTAIVAIGVMLAAICLQTRQESWSYPEAVGGALFLVSGAIFPIVVLPAIVQGIGLLTPLSWWIEGVRQSLFPGGISSIGGDGSLFQSLTGQLQPVPVQIVVALLATGAVATLASIAVFRASDRRAKDRGLLDQTTGS